MTEYGLRKIDMGDWTAGYERRLGQYIDNPKSGFRVFYAHPHPRTQKPMRYIVCKDGFCMGFSVPHKSGFNHISDPSRKAPYVIIDTIGGRYLTDTTYEQEGFVRLADEIYFADQEQQDIYIETLKDAVKRIPAHSKHAARKDGGFGYRVKFTKEISKQIKNNKLIRPKI